MNTKNDYTIQSVQKALKLLKLFNSEHYNDSKQLTLMEICELSGINASSAMRLLYTLNQEGFIAFDPDTKRYSLDIMVYRLGMSMYNSINIHKVAQQYTRELANETGLVVYLATVESGEAVVIDKVFPDLANTWPQMVAQAGFVLPIHSSGIGRLYLAEYSDERVRAILEKRELTRFTPHTVTDIDQLLEIIREVRKTGVSYCNCENEEYIGSICTSIRDYTGKMVAGISLGGIRDVIYGENQQAYTEALVKVAKVISQKMGA